MIWLTGYLIVAVVFLVVLVAKSHIREPIPYGGRLARGLDRFVILFPMVVMAVAWPLAMPLIGLLWLLGGSR
jgi:hypothetical protein